jgi:hypothetical protein
MDEAKKYINLSLPLIQYEIKVKRQRKTEAAEQKVGRLIKEEERVSLEETTAFTSLILCVSSLKVSKNILLPFVFLSLVFFY